MSHVTICNEWCMGARERASAFYCTGCLRNIPPCCSCSCSCSCPRAFPALLTCMCTMMHCPLQATLYHPMTLTQAVSKLWYLRRTQPQLWVFQQGGSASGATYRSQQSTTGPASINPDSATSTTAPAPATSRDSASNTGVAGGARDGASSGSGAGSGSQAAPGASSPASTPQPAGAQAPGALGPRQQGPGQAPSTPTPPQPDSGNMTGSGSSSENRSRQARTAGSGGAAGGAGGDVQAVERSGQRQVDAGAGSGPVPGAGGVELRQRLVQGGGDGLDLGAGPFL